MDKTNILDLIPDVGLGLICGDIRQGKSVLGYWILENIKKDNKFVMGLPEEKYNLLPNYVKFTDDFDSVPPGSVVLIDEAYILLHSRNAMSLENKVADMLAGLIGQRDVLAIYITQQTRRLDVGIVSSAAFIFWKKPSLLQQYFERPQMRKMSADAYSAFIKMDKETAKRSTYVISSDFVGMVENSNEKPTFWSEDLSKAFKGVSITKRENEVEEEIVLNEKTYIGEIVGVSDNKRLEVIFKEKK